MSKPNLIKRIEKLEQPTATKPRPKAVIFEEHLQRYTGQDLGSSEPLSPEAFALWYSQQDKDSVFIVTVCANKPKLEA